MFGINCNFFLKKVQALDKVIINEAQNCMRASGMLYENAYGRCAPLPLKLGSATLSVLALHRIHRRHQYRRL